jgi:hypothetical protein
MKLEDVHLDCISNCLSWDELGHLGQVAGDYENGVVSFALG